MSGRYLSITAAAESGQKYVLSQLFGPSSHSLVRKPKFTAVCAADGNIVPLIVWMELSLRC